MSNFHFKPTGIVIFLWTFSFVIFCALLIFGFFLGVIYSSFFLYATAKNLIMFGSFSATFVASVIAEEQYKRIKSGIFALMGGTGAGAIASLITDNKDLLLVGFAGSAAGALLGWIIALVLCIWVQRSETGKAVLTYLSIGFDGLRQEIITNERIRSKNLQIDALRTWNNFKSKRIQKQLADVMEIKDIQVRQTVSKLIVDDWLACVVNMFEFLYKLAGETAKQYRPRASIIRFENKNGIYEGRHWIFNSGEQRHFQTLKPFTNESIGYKVLVGELQSPYSDNTANRIAENRGNYPDDKSFMAFKVTSETILSVDWPTVLNLEDHFVIALRNFFEEDICPAIGKIIENWEPENDIKIIAK